MKVTLSNEILEKVFNDNEKCLGCNKCIKECPITTDIELNPKKILNTIIENKEINSNIPFSCTFCNKCKEACPVGINFSDIYSNIRKDIFENNHKNLKNFGYNTIKFHQNSSDYSVFKGKSKNILKDKRVFFPGCSLSGYSKDIISKTYKYLKENLDDIGLLVGCCGKPSLDIGDVKGFKERFEDTLKLIKESNIEEIIVACSNCYNVIKKYTDIKVTSLWEVINEVGVPSNVKGLYVYSNMNIALHDPCPTRYSDSIHKSTREILLSVGIVYSEFEKNKKETECCGAGGMMMCTNKNVAINQIKNRVEQTNMEYIVSYCESCVNSMIVGGKKSVHLLDLLFNEEIIKGTKDTQVSRGTLSHWKERRKTASYAKKEI